MPTITEYYGISGPVPFIDVDVAADNRLFIDPHAIRLRSGQPFVNAALECLDTFTDRVTGCILPGTPESVAEGKRLLSRFVEPWETRLGMSRRGFLGHGGAETVGTWIWDVLSDDVEALVRVGVLKQVEDLPLFVEGVDRDITSDLTTRIIYGALALFTAQVLADFPEFSQGLHEVKTFAKQVWSAQLGEWIEAEVRLPVVDGRELLLVPFGWARANLLMSAGRFYETSVLTFAQLAQAVVTSEGKVVKTSKERLKKQAGLERGRATNLAVTMKAFESGQNLLAAFKAFVAQRLPKNEPEQAA